MKKNVPLFLAFVLYVLSLNAQDYKWSSLPVGGAGFVSAVITCPQQQNLIFARTDVGGAYRWVETDKSWKPITDWIPESSCGYMGVESIAIDPEAPNKIYMYCGTSYWSGGKSAVVYSDDYGDTWTEKSIVTDYFPAHGNDNGRQAGEKLAVDPNKGSVLFCGSRTRGLWKSINGGSDWVRIANSTFPDNVKVAFVQFIPSSGVAGAATPTLYVGLQQKGSNNLFVSNDNGATWTAVNGQPTTYMAHRCLLSNGKLYITYTDSEGPGTNGTGSVQKYNLSNQNWTSISPTGMSFGDISVDPTNPDKLMCTSLSMWWQQAWLSTATYGDQIYLSENDGSTWRDLFPSSCSYSEPDIVWLQNSSQLHWAGSAKIDPFNRNRAFITSGNGIYTTENLWSSQPIWHMALKGLEETVPLEIVSVINGPVATAIGDYGGFIYPDVTKYYANYSPSLGTTTGLAVAGKNAFYMVRTGSDAANPSIYTTSNGGNLWTAIGKPEAGSYQGWCAMSADGAIIVWTPSGAKTFYTVNNGAAWISIPGITTTNLRFFADYQTPNVFYANVGGQLRTYTYNTGTSTFSYTSSVALSNAVNRLTVVPGKSGEIWVARGSSGLMRISNATSATPTTNNLALSNVTCVGVGKEAPGKTYPSLFIWGNPLVSDLIGLYRSDDEGLTWIRINDNQHQFGGPGNAQFVKGDMNVYGRVFMSTVGRGIIMGESTISTGVSDMGKGSNIAVSGSVFSENLTVTSERDANYQIYNLNGIMVEDGKIYGSATIGSNISNGMYILVIKNKEGQLTKKITKLSSLL